VIDLCFFFDIIVNFRTTFHNTSTGEEIMEKKAIAHNYVFGMFLMDLLSTIPFDQIAAWFVSKEGAGENDSLEVISMLKTFRIFRLSKLIAFLDATEEIKLNL